MDTEIDPESSPKIGFSNPTYDETGEQIQMQDLSRDTPGQRSTHYNLRSLGPVYEEEEEEEEETSLVKDPTEPLIRKSKKIDASPKRIKNKQAAFDFIKSKFPNFNPANAPFKVRVNEYNELFVKLDRAGAKYHPLLDANDEVNEKLPKSITDSLGPPAEDIVETNEEAITRSQERIAELEEQRATTSGENQRENLNQTINEEREAIAELERMNEEIEERMTLRDRVKAIFKKYGFTVLAVVSAVGVVIGVIVSNLKNGLTTLGKGVGNGLKAVGKKLGEILPGLAGAIASFVFRTAGEVVSFLAKNAWLLIVAVVLYLIEQFKKKK